MFGVALVDQSDDDTIVSMLCNDANDVEDVYEREYTCKSVVTDGRRQCAFNKQTAVCESIHDLVEDEVVRSIKSGRTRGLVPVTEFAEQQFVRENPDANARLNFVFNQFTNEMEKKQSKSLMSIHPLAQLGLMLVLYAKRGMVFTKLANEPLMQQLTALMGVNALRLLFDALAGSENGSEITQIGTTLLKLFFPGNIVDTVLAGVNMITTAGLWRYLKKAA